MSDTRARIVLAASRLFYEQGYNRTGINQVIDEAGVAKASLYQHFAAKEDLLTEYLTQTSQQWFSDLATYFEKAQTPKDKVLATFDMLLDFAQRVRFRGCNFQNILSEVPMDNQHILDLVRNHKQRMRHVFEKLLAEQDAGSVAEQISVLFEGALISSQIQQDIRPIKAARQAAERLL